MPPHNSRAANQRTIDWLLGVDPAIRWQAMRDLLDAPQAQWRAERAAVETEGWGASLIARQDTDGQWAGGAFVPAGFAWERFQTEGQPWTATCWALTELRDLGLDPTSETAQRTARLVGENSRWDHDGQPYWDGEVEECINGRTVAQGGYFGVDVVPIVERLLGEQMADGGWNCERERGSFRSSFDSTLNVLEGLLQYEQVTDDGRVTTARTAGEEYLLERRLMYRLTSGELVDPEYLQPVYPARWQYTIVRALDYFRAAALHTGTGPDPRLAEAVAVLRGKRREDGTWATERRHRGAAWLAYDDGAGTPSPWLTLQALRILQWWDSAH